MDWLKMLAIAGMNGGGSGGSGGASPEEVVSIVKEQFPGGVGYKETVVVTEPLRVTWDGNTEGLASFGDFYKVSDIVLTDEQIKSTTVSVPDVGTLTLGMMWDNLVVTPDYVYAPVICFCRTAGATFDGFTIPEVGVYLTDQSAGATLVLPIEHNERTELVTVPISAEYLPKGGFGYTRMVEVFPEQEITLESEYKNSVYEFPFVVNKGDFVEVTVDGVLYSGKMALWDVWSGDTLFMCDESGTAVAIPVLTTDGFLDPAYPAFFSTYGSTTALMTPNTSYPHIATVRVCVAQDVPIEHKYLPRHLADEFVVTITEDLETGDLIADKSNDEVNEAGDKGQYLRMLHPWYGQLFSTQALFVQDGVLYVSNFAIGENNVVTETTTRYTLTPVTE